MDHFPITKILDIGEKYQYTLLDIWILGFPPRTWYPQILNLEKNIINMLFIKFTNRSDTFTKNQIFKHTFWAHCVAYNP